MNKRENTTSLKSQYIHLCGEELELLPQKAIFWPAQNCLLIADVHFGKVNHFRKSGIGIPHDAGLQNEIALAELFELVEAERVIFLGDLFHSVYNDSWEKFGQLMNTYPSIKFELIRGNHDILQDQQYEKFNLTVFEELILGPFLLTHEPIEEENVKGYNLAGHIHPGVALSGKGKQYTKVACFYFGVYGGILPAFGKFTGTAKMKIKKKDRVFVVADGEVLEV